jgi:hypothetical protein
MASVTWCHTIDHHIGCVRREKLRKAVLIHKFDWAAVAQLVGRSKASCRHRWQDQDAKLPENAILCTSKHEGAVKRPPLQKDRTTEKRAHGGPIVSEKCKTLLRTSLLARRIPVENSVQQVNILAARLCACAHAHPCTAGTPTRANTNLPNRFGSGSCRCAAMRHPLHCVFWPSLILFVYKVWKRFKRHTTVWADQRRSACSGDVRI